MKKALCLILALMLCLPGISAFADVEGTVQGDIMLTSTEGTEVETEETTEAEEPTEAEETETTQETEDVVFNDILADSALGNAIYKLVEAGVIAGYGDGTFRPNSGLTRAELCKMINLVFNLSESASEMEFTDVSEQDWYYDYVLVAVQAGYIKGFQDNTFRGDDPVTREQVCAIINRVTTSKGLGLFDLPFTDNIMDEVSDWALEDVKKIIANYIMPLENGKFRATENITRAELALALEGFIIELPEYTVTFNTKGGNEIENAIVKEGSTVTKPEDPEKKNNTFDGWYTDEKLKNAYDFTTAVTTDITLYAKWTPKSTGGGGGVSTGGSSYTPSVTYYTVTFETNGGSEIASVSVAHNNLVTKPEAPVMEGYEFKDWYKDADLLVPYNFGTAVTANITLYAKWEIVYTTEEINEKQIADFTLIKQVMEETEFENARHIEMMDIIIPVFAEIVSTCEAGTIISKDYISETYASQIAEIKTIYDSMLPITQESFTNIGRSMIDKCQARGLQMTLEEITDLASIFWNF